MHRTAALVALAAGCASGADDSDVVRGRGLQRAALAPADEARVYDAAVRASFDVGPDLVLLAHPRRLPRTAGTSDGDSLPGDLLRALREQGVVRGSCDPRREGPRDTPRCDVDRPGYVIRSSDVLRLSRDTLQVYFAAEAFAPARGLKPQALAFEKIYLLVGEGTAWRVAREARARAGGR